jgi:hypothetical protein
LTLPSGPQEFPISRGILCRCYSTTRELLQNLGDDVSTPLVAVVSNTWEDCTIFNDLNWSSITGSNMSNGKISSQW